MDNKTVTYYSFDVLYGYGLSNTIQVPFIDIGKQYVLILDYANGRIGFGKPKFDFGMLLIILVAIAITFGGIAIIAKKAKREGMRPVTFEHPHNN